MYLHAHINCTQVSDEINQPELECNNYQLSYKIVQQLQHTQHGFQLIWVKEVQLPKCWVQLFQVCNKKKSHGTNPFVMKFHMELHYKGIQLLS